MKALYTDKNIDELQEKITLYFNTEVTPGFAGLAYALGFASRQTLWEYSKKDTAVSLPIKRALLYIEADYEKALRDKSCTGAIFALKNRGWSDKTEVEHTTIDNKGDATGIIFK